MGKGRRRAMLVHIFLLKRMTLLGLPSSLMIYQLFLEVLLSLELRRLYCQMITTEVVKWSGHVGKGRRRAMLVHIFLMQRMTLLGLQSSLMICL
jgi:hypothetical protein